jgi:sugar phosphate isomerase/epimerase
VPGLSLTLDHSHFVFHGIPYEQIAAMHAHGTHWHARQAALGRLQTGLEQGEIDFQRIVGDLVADGYDGVIALEVVHTSWLQLDGQDVLSETVRLRDQLRELLREAGAEGWGLTETEASA